MQSTQQGQQQQQKEEAASTRCSMTHSEPQGAQGDRREMGLRDRAIRPSLRGTTQGDSQIEKLNLGEIKKKVNELYKFSKDEHLVIKYMVTSIKSTILAAER